MRSKMGSGEENMVLQKILIWKNEIRLQWTANEICTIEMRQRKVHFFVIRNETIETTETIERNEVHKRSWRKKKIIRA